MSLSGIHEEFFDVSKCLMPIHLLLYWQNVLCAVECINDVLVTACNGKKRPCVGSYDKRQAVVQNVE